MHGILRVCKATQNVPKIVTEISITAMPYKRRDVANHRNLHLFELTTQKTSKLRMTCPLWRESIDDQSIPLKKGKSSMTLSSNILWHRQEYVSSIVMDKFHKIYGRDEAPSSTWCPLPANCFYWQKVRQVHFRSRDRILSVFKLAHFLAHIIWVNLLVVDALIQRI